MTTIHGQYICYIWIYYLASTYSTSFDDTVAVYAQYHTFVKKSEGLREICSVPTDLDVN